MAEQKTFTHFDAAGNARMVDISGKISTNRLAVAAGRVIMAPETLRMVREGLTAKGDALGVARVAGIMAAKKVAGLIPLCHPLAVNRVDIDFSFPDEGCSVAIQATVGINGRTGVEMEALTAVSVAALTLYDMCKAVDKNMVISDIRLLVKSGGKSGKYVREQEQEINAGG
jgi:cyclic pyranopterin monophosphate synthase